MLAVSNYSLSIRVIIYHVLNVKYSGLTATVESFLLIHTKKYLING